MSWAGFFGGKTRHFGGFVGFLTLPGVFMTRYPNDSGDSIQQEPLKAREAHSKEKRDCIHPCPQKQDSRGAGKLLLLVWLQFGNFGNFLFFLLCSSAVLSPGNSDDSQRNFFFSQPHLLPSYFREFSLTLGLGRGCSPHLGRDRETENSQ